MCCELLMQDVVYASPLKINPVVSKKFGNTKSDIVGPGNANSVARVSHDITDDARGQLAQPPADRARMRLMLRACVVRHQ